MELTEAVARVKVARPGLALHPLATAHPDERVLAGGGEVFRLPLAPSAVARHAVLVRALPRLVPLVPVPLAPPRYVGVLADGATPFTAEPLLPGVRPAVVEGIALGQLEGVLAALEAVPVREAVQWGVSRLGPPGGDVLQHPGLAGDPRRVLLADPRTGLLTGVVDWDLVLARPPASA